MTNQYSKIKKLLTSKDFSYSKDWRQSDEVGRVEWLILSLKNKSEEISRLDKTVEELLLRIEQKEQEVQHWKSLVGKHNG